VRLEIGPAGHTWKVSLPTSGPLTASVTPPGAKIEVRIPATIDVADQFPAAKGKR
jgi:hypothetical protein